MVKILTKNDFKSMPWRNSQGITIEMFRETCPQNPDEFILRLSKAHIGNSGPYSIFPEIDRGLVLLSGNGFSLQGDESSVSLTSPFDTFIFKGEEQIFCSLIQGECWDFNFMIKRNIGNFKIDILTNINSSLNSFTSDHTYMFIFNPDEDILYCLKQNESVEIANSIGHNFIIVTVGLI